MRAFLLASILALICISSCRAAPRATTIVSAFKQALSSAEDESTEETTTQAKIIDQPSPESSGEEIANVDTIKTSIVHDVEIEHLKIVTPECDPKIEEGSGVENPGSEDDIEGSGGEPVKLIKRVSRILSKNKKDKLVLQGQTEKVEKKEDSDESDSDDSDSDDSDSENDSENDSYEERDTANKSDESVEVEVEKKVSADHSKLSGVKSPEIKKKKNN